MIKVIHVIIIFILFITEKYFLFDDEILCEDDFCLKSKLVCFKCKKLIKNEHISVLGKKFHFGCFSCFECKKKMKENDLFVEENSRIYCHEHFPDSVEQTNTLKKEIDLQINPRSTSIEPFSNELITENNRLQMGSLALISPLNL